LTDKARFIKIPIQTKVEKEFDDEKNIPTQQSKTKKESWFSCPDEHKRRKKNYQEPAEEGENKTGRLMAETLSLRGRLRYRKDFSQVYANGKRYRGKYFILVYLPNKSGYSRFAAVASKKIGNAVQRNHAKRRIRALFRRNKHLSQESLDMIFISKPGIVTAPWQLLEKDFVKALETAGFYN